MPIANPKLVPPQDKYPAKAHCRRVVKQIESDGGSAKGAICFVEGQSTQLVEDDDQEVRFRQRRNFFYLTGCELPDCFFVYDADNDESTLFIPPVDEQMVLWAGMPMLPAEAKENYDVDIVFTTDQVKEKLHHLAHSTSHRILIIPERTSLSLLPSQPPLDNTTLRHAIETCRIVKDAHEVSLLRYSNAVASWAHEQVQRASSLALNERELNALFTMHCHANSCKEQAYACISASGSNAATLHYVRNDSPLTGRLNLLLDAGCEYKTYCSDITRTFPLTKTGKFTPESREIYSLVLKMQEAAARLIKGGVMWEECHMAAHTAAAEGLRSLGILNPSVEAIMKSKVTTRFFPHGLGHYVGMDTHDVGGNVPEKETDEFFKYLRIRGRVPAGAVVTNEPGVYFREALRKEVERGMWEGVVDRETLWRYWDVGGVRIEDDYVVTEEGWENLTTVSSRVEDVEKLVQERGVVGLGE
ncbi:hypothetical protein K470DRAFT_224632 [Piedraia hortae CBS 480.64]|uniref:Xaa-Pro aminopeptidase n=1 Tax=Piedraia hortae CBS 480.64 TaxID=1314780 RepID=A0A6A7CAN9_9PEZI|nr:hypothetical protein K470DRAFT_224632 [Piedraia hortae CBS 480.64]